MAAVSRTSPEANRSTSSPAVRSHDAEVDAQTVRFRVLTVQERDAMGTDVLSREARAASDAAVKIAVLTLQLKFGPTDPASLSEFFRSLTREDALVLTQRSAQLNAPPLTREAPEDRVRREALMEERTREHEARIRAYAKAEVVDRLARFPDKRAHYQSQLPILARIRSGELFDLEECRRLTKAIARMAADNPLSAPYDQAHTAILNGMPLAVLQLTLRWRLEAIESALASPPAGTEGEPS